MRAAQLRVVLHEQTHGWRARRFSATPAIIGPILGAGSSRLSGGAAAMCSRGSARSCFRCSGVKTAWSSATASAASSREARERRDPRRGPSPSPAPGPPVLLEQLQELVAKAGLAVPQGVNRPDQAVLDLHHLLRWASVAPISSSFSFTAKSTNLWHHRGVAMAAEAPVGVGGPGSEAESARPRDGAALRTRSEGRASSSSSSGLWCRTLERMGRRPFVALSRLRRSVKRPTGGRAASRLQA